MPKGMQNAYYPQTGHCGPGISDICRIKGKNTKRLLKMWFVTRKAQGESRGLWSFVEGKDWHIGRIKASWCCRIKWLCPFKSFPAEGTYVHEWQSRSLNAKLRQTSSFLWLSSCQKPTSGAACTGSKSSAKWRWALNKVMLIIWYKLQGYMWVCARSMVWPPTHN